MGIEADYYERYVGLSPEDFIRRTQLENPHEMERAQRIADALPGDVASVLDIGCGAGIALHQIRERFSTGSVRGVGLERSAVIAAAARSLFGLEIVEASAEALPFPDRSFDYVMANEVLEHLPWNIYTAALKEIERVADRGILITTPYNERRQFVTCPECTCSFNPFYHVRSFSDSDLSGLFDGFQRTEQELVWVRGRTPLLYEARRLKAALGFMPPLPNNTICPQCAYRNVPKSPESSSGTAKPEQSERPLNRFVTSLWGRLPRPKRPKWAIVSYRRRA